MKPRNVLNKMATKTLSFSALSISLLASTAFGQLIEITEPNTESTSSASELPQELRSSNENTLSTQPVSISTGMSPRVAPQPNLTVPSVSTGIGGNNPGNANTGGVQVQSVNVSTVQDTNTNSNNRADLIRRERLRRELENETRLLEKIEEGRLEDESRRAKTVDSFDSKLPGEETTHSAPVVVAAPIYAVNTPMTMPSTLTSTVSSDNSSSASFKVTPFVGYRWYRNSFNSIFRMQNLFLVGASIEGSFNPYLGLEGSFTYGRDQIANQGFSYAGYSPAVYRGNCLGCGGYGNNVYGAGGTNVNSRDSFEFVGSVKAGIPAAKVKPYGVAGIGFLHQQYNLNPSYTAAIYQASGLDTATNHMMGVFGGGIDVEVAQNFSLGARFDYQTIVNRRLTDMQIKFGDTNDRYRLTGNLQLSF
jgi:hypothetical protein